MLRSPRAETAGVAPAPRRAARTGSAHRVSAVGGVAPPVPAGVVLLGVTARRERLSWRQAAGLAGAAVAIVSLTVQVCRSAQVREG